MNSAETPSTDNQESTQEQPAEAPSQPKQNDNTVFVGTKHLMNYVKSIEMQLQNNPEVIIKSRGKFISKAVDIAEVAKRQLANVQTKDILIGTEEYEKDGKKIKVSTIEITLSK